MHVVYRMRGLMGEATEDMVNELTNENEEDEDDEQKYKFA